MVTIALEAVFVAAFIALVAGILLWLRAADRKLAKLVKSAEALEGQVKLAAAEVTELTKPAAQTLRTVQGQLAGAARLFEAAERLGDAAADAASALSRVTGSIAMTAERHFTGSGGRHRERIEGALDWAEAGYAAWRFWQSKRKEAQSSACSGYGEGHDNDKTK